MTQEEMIQNILKERRIKAQISEYLADDYSISEDRGMLGHPFSIEYNPTLDAIHLGFSTDEERPFDKPVLFIPAHSLGIKSTSIRVESMQDDHLANGMYYSLDDIKEALEKELLQDGPDTIYVAWKTGKRFSATELISDLICKLTKLNSYSYLIASNEVENGVRYEHLRELRPESEEEKRQKVDLGRFWTGRADMPSGRYSAAPLGSGKYIFGFEVERALTEYIRLEKRKEQELGGGSQEIDGLDIVPPVGPLPPEKTPSQITSTPEEHPVVPTEEPEISLPLQEEPHKGPKAETPETDGITENEPTPPQPQKEEPELNKDELLTVILRKGKIPNKILVTLLPLIMASLIFLEGLGLEDEKIIQKIEEELINAHISISQMEQISVEDQYRNAFDRLGVKIGMPETMQKGVQYHESSDFDRGGKNATGVFGSKIRPEGDYVVESYSLVLPDGTLAVTWKDGTKLEDFVKETCDKYSVTIEQLSIRLHIGSPVAGWVVFEDIGSLQNNANNLKDAKVILEEKEIYQGVIENFEGQTITFDSEGQSVTINVVDENGNLLAPGTIVQGSDGQSYKITELSTQAVTNTYEQEVLTGNKKLTWRFSNISKEEWLLNAAAAALGIGTIIVTRKKEEEYAQLTDEQLDQMINEVKQRYSSESVFARAVMRVTGRAINPNLEYIYGSSAATLRASVVDQETTLEELGNMKGNRR